MNFLHHRARRAHVHLVTGLVLFLSLECGPLALRADDWPQWLGPQRDAVWRETGIVEKLPADGLKYRWRVPIGGGYAGPAVAKGRVFVIDRQLASGASSPTNPFARGTIPGS